jgi:hypothetical protein
LAEIEAKRDAIPDSENGALLVMAAAQLMRASWPRPTITSPSFDEIVQEQSPESQLDEKQVSKLRAAVAQVTQALGPARKLAGYPKGRHAIAWSYDGIGTMLPHVEPVRKVAELLSMDAMLHAHDGDPDAAVAACRACLNAGRSLGDEPTLSQLVRLGCRRLALHSLERTLSHGEASGSVLKQLQQLLEDESDQPVLLRMARADRALTHQGLDVIRAREFNRRSYGLVQPFGLPDGAMNLMDAAQARACHAALLRFGTEFVEIAKLPPEEQRDRLEQLKEPDVQQPTIFRSWGRERNWPAKDARACWNSDGLLHCTIAALAAERFRQDNRRWPDSLKELTPEYLRTVPADPFDGKELRFRRLQDGIVFYTLGPDCEDNGGNLTRRYTPPPGTDIGFRLWNAAHRRQPAKKAR